MDETKVLQQTKEEQPDIEFSGDRWVPIMSGMPPGRFPGSGYEEKYKEMALSPGEEKLLSGQYFVNYGVIESVSKDGRRFTAPAADDLLEQLKEAGYRENLNVVVHFSLREAEQKLEFARKILSEKKAIEKNQKQQGGGAEGEVVMYKVSGTEQVKELLNEAIEQVAALRKVIDGLVE